MATYPLSFPSKAPAREKLQLNYRQTAMESPHTGAFQATNTAAQWNLEVTWGRMTQAEAQIVAAWINSLKGQVGTFRYSPRINIGVPVTGVTLAQPAYAYGDVCRMGGWAAGAETRLRVGQFFNLGDQLLQITAVAAIADGNGHALVEFSPMLRKDFAAGTEANFTKPTGVFRLISAESPAPTLDTDRAPEFPTLQAKEAI
ncbi:hypothetical protein [Sphingomonas xinjiangensis]|uniref:Uncharacterized protein n=1 Tax=Sphingomonas xinjiangensis TaxID=643568 RepID=A0A840YAY1_9SPHN|nr:hypothetical protein [Sphingomonas xinjiangensis]MBB5709445.1 hypothetical protein [Sphingomonas xinjiangensis]